MRPVLVIDDDPDVRALVRELLLDAGYACVTAEDGLDALQRVEELPPRLILLDIEMPRMDGRAFARTLRERLVQVPIVVVTGRERPDRAADSCNAVAVLAKPFAVDDLLSLVRRYA